MAKIENPKVFISYAWTSREYQNRVISFATQLMKDGVEVILDVWDLEEGNDTHAFMEQCINEPTITNVLILVNPAYADKANGRQGGVGEETQIISPEIYNDPKQTKFIPVVFQRNTEGIVCRPTYLKGRLYFDLSKPEEYEDNYRRLVKKLYGERTYEKPTKGSTPAWVRESSKKHSEKPGLFKPAAGYKPNWLPRKKSSSAKSRPIHPISEQMNK